MMKLKKKLIKKMIKKNSSQLALIYQTRDQGHKTRITQ